MESGSKQQQQADMLRTRPSRVGIDYCCNRSAMLYCCKRRWCTHRKTGFKLLPDDFERHLFHVRDAENLSHCSLQLRVCRHARHRSGKLPRSTTHHTPHSRCCCAPPRATVQTAPWGHREGYFLSGYAIFSSVKTPWTRDPGKQRQTNNSRRRRGQRAE